MCDVCVKELDQDSRNLLERHRADYAAITGKPFEHFFCPILFDDAPAKLIRGHIINDAFKGSPGAWVIQRGAADYAYGSYFESDFELTQHMEGAIPLDYLFNKKLYNAMPPILLIKGQRRKYYPYRKKWLVPPGIQLLAIEYKGRELEFCLEATPDELRENPIQWHINIPRDFPISITVSLIKTAHLSMFSLFGYRYALSYAGRFIGNDILGTFYRENMCALNKKEVQRRALSFFKPYHHIVRLIQFGASDMEGTLNDGLVNLCAGASGQPWAMIIFIRTADLRSAAIIPYPEDAGAFATYRDFLSNDHETIHVNRGVFEGHQWSFENERKLIRWPKDRGVYP